MTPTPAPATRAAVTAAVLRALELAAELGVVRVWGVVKIRKEGINVSKGML